MNATGSGGPAPLPGWVKLLGSMVIVGHFLAILGLVLSAPSGPWPTPFGSDMALGPQFADSINAVATPYYFRPLSMTHNYHFLSNRTAVPGVFFEVKLRDAQGKEIQTVKIPDGKANYAVHHRQDLLARGLADDQPIQPAGPERVASPTQKVGKYHYWFRDEEIRKLIEEKVIDPKAVTIAPVEIQGKQVNHLYLVAIPEDQMGAVPRTRPYSGPSEWALILARSYVRHLCRQYGAASGEITRHSREAVLPAYMFLPNPPPDSFTEMVAHFGPWELDAKEPSR